MNISISTISCLAQTECASFWTFRFFSEQGKRCLLSN